MRRTFAFLLAVFLMLGFAACKKKPAVTTDSGTYAPDSSMTTVSDTSASSDTTALEVEMPPYDLVRHSVQTAALDCTYDVLTLGNAETDAALAAFAEEIFVGYLPNASSLAEAGGSAVYTAELAEIYFEKRLVSAAFAGTYAVTAEDGRETRGEVYYTVNVDRASGRLLSGGDLVVDFDMLADMLVGGRFSPAALSADDLAQYRPEYDIYPYFRLDAENFYVGVNFPGVAETNSEYAISRADAAAFLAAAYR